MSMEITPQTPKKELMIQDPEKARKFRAAYSAKASSDFYSGIGWVIGLLITLFVSIPVIWFLSVNAPRSTAGDIRLWGIAIAWWLNPLSLGALGYIFSNLRSWRFWTIFAFMVWGFVNILVSAAILDERSRILIANGLIILGYILFGLWILYIQLRVFLLAVAGKSGRFFFGSLGWAALNVLIYWAVINPEVLNVILVVLGFALRILFAIAFAIMQFVAIFWFMARSRVEIIRPGDPKTLTFDDYKGQPNLLKMVRQWISLLSDRTQFQKMGGQFI